MSDKTLEEIVEEIQEKQLEQDEKLDEIIEKLDNLGLPGSGFGVEDFND